MLTYPEFFRALTGHPPYPYQHRLAEGVWPTLLDVPTGLGKTAAVLVAWLWRRFHGDSQTGRRLAYCLPMRSLVTQTFEVARALCDRSASYFSARGLPTPSVHAMLGGYVDGAWERSPATSCVLVGTQDMLLSRALNRGYAMSRFKWPMHFGLLNNDVIWVLDETQLMGVGVETSAQLQGLRDSLGTLGPTRTLWMSATLHPAQLDTFDHPQPADGWSALSLDSDDYDLDRVRERVQAGKPLGMHPVALRKDTEKHYAKLLAQDVAKRHRARGGLTLVIINRVSRAQAVFGALAGEGLEALGLVHSRFRPGDRGVQEAMLHAHGDRVVVATQAVEAGLDVSAHTLITELCPWSSLVQRFGRCNRDGQDLDAQILWVDVEAASKDERALPYAPEHLDRARILLSNLDDAGPQTLQTIEQNPPQVVRPILRRRDLMMLFDTTPDLSGHDLDVAPYVRDSQDTDVQLYWRCFDGDPNDILESEQLFAAPTRDELCRISLRGARQLLGTLAKRPSFGRGWRWSWAERKFKSVSSGRIYPGDVLLLPSMAGGYDPGLGFTGQVDSGPVGSATVSEAILSPAVDDLSHEGDPDTFVAPTGCWVELAEHLSHVEYEAATLSSALGLDEWSNVLSIAGRWHDVGKSHPEFQARLRSGGNPPCADALYAKSPHRAHRTKSRPGLRHELASALAWLAHHADDEPRARDLVAYLVAAHHGKVRVSLRALPHERPPSDADLPFARGIWHGDVLPNFTFDDDHSIPVTTLDLSVMRIGAGSWLSRVVALRDEPELGPFRLALLETLVRIADWIASDKEQQNA